MAVKLSAKHIAIDKANTTVLVAIGVTTFIVVMTGLAGKALFNQMRYQSKVIGQKEKTLKQVKANQKAVDQLKVSYQEFADKKENILGGNSSGTGDKDGENARIVLDALPSKYDFPALATSLEKLLRNNGYQIDGITGTDDEVVQSEAENSANANPQPVEIPFSVSVSASNSNTKQLLALFEKSIRPIQVKKITLKGQTDGVKLDIDAKTYFQPQKKFNVTLEKVSGSGTSTAKTTKKTETKK